MDKAMNVLRAYASAAKALNGLDRDAYLSVAAALIEAAPGDGRAGAINVPKQASPYVVRVKRKTLAGRIQASLREKPQTAKELSERFRSPLPSIWRALRQLRPVVVSGNGARNNPKVLALR